MPRGGNKLKFGQLQQNKILVFLLGNACLQVHIAVIIQCYIILVYIYIYVYINRGIQIGTVANTSGWQ